MIKNFKGTGVALITPFKDGQIDWESYKNMLDHVFEGGVDYLIPLGSTGEAATLSGSEQREALDFVISYNKGRKPLVAGNFGGTNTMAICQQIENYNFDGIDAILSASPSYVKPSQQGIYQHFESISKASPVPVIMYNVPSRTHSNMTWETTIKLATDFDNIIGIKEASGDLSQCTQIVKHKPDNFLVISGDDETALALTALGGDGVISVIANALPKKFSMAIQAGLRGDMTEANRLNQEIFGLHKWLYSEGNPVGIKAATEHLGLATREVRLPLNKMSEEGVIKLKRELESILTT